MLLDRVVGEVRAGRKTVAFNFHRLHTFDADQSGGMVGHRQQGIASIPPVEAL
jgi:hypothetical protein